MSSMITHKNKKAARARFIFTDMLPLAAGNLLVSAGCAMAPVFLDALIDQPHRAERDHTAAQVNEKPYSGCVAFQDTCV